MSTVSSTYDWAYEYLCFEAKEGRFPEDWIVGKSKEEVIQMANKMEARGQAEYDRQKEETCTKS